MIIIELQSIQSQSEAINYSFTTFIHFQAEISDSVTF